MIKWIAPTVMALSVLGGIAAPASAQRYDRDYNRDYGYTSRDYRGNRGEQADRMSELRSRINRLYNDGRLSREHRDRALDKLERVRDDVRSGRIGGNRARANDDWMDSISRDVDNWSRADSRHLRRDNRWR